mmetsp:Transcript_31982/g.55132  ORF Transcript_31982/g.55132 Transcript_31982/m.55132 type:complete len:213 (+) Transcript_31982:1411-2049(+)
MEEKLIQRKREVLYVWAFIALQVTAGVLVILSCALKHWFKYCWWHFGLVSAYTAYDDQFNSEETIADVIYDACGNAKVIVEDSCPHFCKYADNFELAGIIMVVASTLSLVSMILVIIIHVTWLVNQEFRFKTVFWIAIIPPLLYSAGLLTYTLTANLNDLHYTHNKPYFKDPSNIRMEGGLILACISALFNLVPFAFLYFFTLPLLRRSVKN